MKILYFNCNKNSYKANETLTVFWEVEDAEKIELYPYGYVEAKGIKTIAVPINTSGAFTIRLRASNSSENTNIEKEIKLFDYPTKDLNSNPKIVIKPEVHTASGDSLFSTIIQYIIIGVVAIICCGIGYDYIKKNTTLSSKENKLTVDNSPKVSQKEEKQVYKSCDFSNAYEKTDAKMNALLLAKISDDETVEDTNDCSVTYKFFVKQRGYDIEGKEYIEDKIKHLFLTYRKIGSDYEFIEGKLFSGVNETEYKIID